MFNTIPIEIPAGICRYRQADSEIYAKVWEMRIIKTITKNKNKVGRLTWHNLKSWYKTRVTRLYCNNERIDHWLEVQKRCPEIDLNKCDQMIFENGEKSTQ